ncbi:MAG TPA: hemerythrin domain-containing protein [Candidatus Tectomicrobia bacterium]|nr:hemerythrin domain-containing protein [Candidatus Tectomicrobia bacterium]
MDPLQLLKKQHREVEGLFKKVLKAEGASERKELMQQIAHHLELHTKIEEEIFYPAVREVESKKAEEMVLEAYEEHHVVKLVLHEFPQVDPEDERFHAKMTVLHELVQHHVAEEEKEMFKLAGKIEDEEMEEIGERMVAEVEAAGGQVERRQRRAA